MDTETFVLIIKMLEAAQDASMAITFTVLPIFL